jgi:hypothetical protein
VLFLERPNRRDGEKPPDPELFETVDIGTKIQLTWADAMSAAMTREECDLATFKFADEIGIGRGSERGREFMFLDLGKAGHGVEATPANDSDLRLQRPLLDGNYKTTIIEERCAGLANFFEDAEASTYAGVARRERYPLP